MAIPWMMVSRPSPSWMKNPMATFSQSMMQAAGPFSDQTVIALPRSSMSRLPAPVYVPSATSTVSPFTAASIPAWIVGWSPGTWMMDPKARQGKQSRARAEWKIRINMAPLTGNCGKDLIEPLRILSGVHDANIDSTIRHGKLRGGELPFRNSSGQPTDTFVSPIRMHEIA
jgi:hypothetical protein